MAGAAHGAPVSQGPSYHLLDLSVGSVCSCHLQLEQLEAPPPPHPHSPVDCSLGFWDSFASAQLSPSYIIHVPRAADGLPP